MPENLAQTMNLSNPLCPTIRNRRSRRLPQGGTHRGSASVTRGPERKRKRKGRGHMKAREHINGAVGEGAGLRGKRSLALRRVAMVSAMVVGLAILPGSMLSAAQAAGLFKFTQYKVPTAASAPSHTTVGADGNLWFTESNPEFNVETFTRL